MYKIDFLSALESALKGLPEDDISRTIEFYNEMIDDMTENGMSEKEATATIGSVDEIASRIISEIPITKLVKKRIKPKKRLGALEITLIILGSPIWLSLLISGAAVFISLYISIWAIIISLWSVFASFVGCALAGIAVAILMFVTGNIPVALLMLASGFALSGLSIFAFFGCKSLIS